MTCYPRICEYEIEENDVWLRHPDKVGKVYSSKCIIFISDFYIRHEAINVWKGESPNEWSFMIFQVQLGMGVMKKTTLANLTRLL